MSDITRSYPTNIVAGGDTTSTVLKAHDPEIVKIYEWLTDLRSNQPSTASTRPANPNTHDATYDTDDGLIYRYNGATWEAQTVASLNIPYRQTVLSGPANSATGTAACIVTSSASLTVQLYATATNPVVVSFMDGYDANGAKDIIAVQYSAVATFWTGLTQNATNYLYFNSTGGVLSGGQSVIAPVYSFSTPAHVSGLHWINVNTGIVQVSDGSNWSTVNRVFIAECVTNSTGVTSSTIYPYNSQHNLVTDSTLSGNSDFWAPSEKAVKAAIATGQQLPIALGFSITPGIKLWSDPFVIPCAANFSRCDVLCKIWGNNAAESPNQATTFTIYNSSGTSLDDVTFTTGATIDSTWNFSVPANDILQCKVSAVNNLTGTVSGTIRGVRT